MICTDMTRKESFGLMFFRKKIQMQRCNAHSAQLTKQWLQSVDLETNAEHAYIFSKITEINKLVFYVKNLIEI